MKVLPLYLPHQGCSHVCVYCNQPLVVGTTNDRQDWLSRIQSHITNRPAEQWEIAFYGGTFSGLSQEEMQDCFKDLSSLQACNNILGYRISTRPDCIDSDILSFLREKRVRTIELGVESLDDEVLLRSGRGHNASVSRNACLQVIQAGFSLGVHLMCGLPGQNEESWRRTVEEIIHVQPAFVRIAPTLVLKGTPLERLYRRGAYVPMNLEDAIKQCCFAYARFYRERIPVARIGLALSDSTGDGANKIVAGPWHPALRHEVESLLAGENILHQLRNANTNRVIVNPKDYSIVIGAKRKNLDSWRKELHKEVIVEREDRQLRYTFSFQNNLNYSLFLLPDE